MAEAKAPSGRLKEAPVNDHGQVCTGPERRAFDGGDEGARHQPHGQRGADVLSTPSLLGLMEQCSIKASDPYLPDGHTTVGYAVDGMRHMAPTSIGARVRVRSVLTEVDRNRLTFSIEAFEGEKKIGMAVHKRAVLSKEMGA